MVESRGSAVKARRYIEWVTRSWEEAFQEAEVLALSPRIIVEVEDRPEVAFTRRMGLLYVLAVRRARAGRKSAVIDLTLDRRTQKGKH